MGCPLCSKCEYLENLPSGSAKYSQTHHYCHSRNGWNDCPVLDRSKIPLPMEIAKKEQRNMIIGIVIGIVIGFITGISGGIGVGFLGVIIGAIYGIGFSSISETFDALDDFFGRNGCLSVILFLFVMPFLVGFGITSIVGIVRYFKRKQLL